jgi:glutamate N-acetyltransferase/amino-acid N-acetyltransferase
MGPKGFHYGTVSAGIKTTRNRDIALIFSEVDANIAGTFTTNAVKAAPVQICLKKISSGKARAIVVNSGNANACTGTRGVKDTRDIVSLVSKQLGIHSAYTYMCSTGVIGTPLPMKKIVPAIKKLTGNIGNSSLKDVAKAIMTTDTFPKLITRKIKIGKKTGTISGVCKGAGMIAPHMATMLCFILTDIAIDQKTLNFLLRSSVKQSFNRITIDGDMSTNDTVLMMANGMIGNIPVKRTSPYFYPIQKALGELADKLSRLIVTDAEGATKAVEIHIKNSKNKSEAEAAAFAIANSLLVKTALYGNDPNWGRIMAALGYAGVTFNLQRTDIYFNAVKVVAGGVSNHKDRLAAKALAQRKLKITIDLHRGSASALVLTSDLSEQYVRINAAYRS